MHHLRSAVKTGRTAAQWLCLGVAAALGMRSTSLAEPIFCDGLPCEMSAKEKFEVGLADAVFVGLGSFELVTDAHTPAKKPLSGDIAFRPVVFRVSKVFKGDAQLRALRLKLPVFVKGDGTPPAGTCEPCGAKRQGARGFEQRAREFARLERALENGSLSREEYLKRLAAVRRSALRSSDYDEARNAIVSIKRGAVDVAYRIANVPLRYGDAYILMVFQTLLEDRDTQLFPMNLDIYPKAKAAEVEAALGAATKR